MVTREKDGLYTFKIPNPVITDQFQCFCTIDTPSEYRSNNMTGRMARVYKVNKLDDKGEAVGEPLVLKDVWLEQSALTEREIQNAIFNDIEKFWQAPTEREQMRKLQDNHKQLVKDKGYRHYFLGILSDHAGTTTTDYPAGAVIKTGLLQVPDPKKHTPIIGSGTNSAFSDSCSNNEGTHPLYPNKIEVPVNPRTFEIKKHYRVVFQEVCKTVGRLGTLDEVVDFLALQLLYCAGWVHRDVSLGNIMAYRGNLDNDQEPWKVKLLDLEYAKKFPLPDDYEAAADPKTGTPYFMPLEVMLKYYLYSADTIRKMKVVRKRKSAFDMVDMAEERASTCLTQGPTRAVVHNFQHDLESLWWILLWTVTCRIDSDAAFAYGRTVFVNEMVPTAARIGCFTTESILHLLKSFMPPSTCNMPRSLASTIEAMRYALSVDGTQHTTASAWSAIHLINRKTTDTMKEELVALGRKKRGRTDNDTVDPRQAEGEEKSQAKLAQTDDSSKGKNKE
ncbi:hypothetical protein CVT25_005806 [Psilocybe cyanescens]|uniref:Fungal-type protein kinase domain-containing protein n=1 Tax=Psilocybe cyanescens TaxID=93625 RepID=A0A409W915_PSICY|nr:hypothetical protein CVT25_005806 [Psilocybe cyanescens]